MKQNIDYNQLKRLTSPQFEILLSLIMPKHSYPKKSLLENFENFKNKEEMSFLGYLYSQIIINVNIGKMLEIVTENGKQAFDYTNYPIQGEYGGAGIRVYKGVEPIFIDQKELCDALWDATQYIIKEKEKI